MKGEVDGFHKMRKEGYELQDIQIKNESGHGLDQVYKHKKDGHYAINEAKHGKGLGKLETSGKGPSRKRQASQPYNMDRLKNFREHSSENKASTDELYRQMRRGKVKSYTTSYKGKSHHEILTDKAVPNFRDTTTVRKIE